MIADGLIDIVNWVIQTFIYPLFRTNYPLLSYTEYQNILGGLKDNFIYTFSVIDKLFPVSLLLIFIGLIIFAEITLFVIKLGMWFLNLIRGSGA